MNRRALNWIVVAGLGCLAGAPIAAQANDDRDQKAIEIFEKHVRPTLVEQCIRCHGPEKQKGGLRLDSANSWSEGGDSGPALAPGDQQSLLLRAIRYDDTSLEMPPRGKLPVTTIEAFQEWIRLGAIDPRSTDPQEPSGQNAVEASVGLEEGRSFWAFQPLRPIAPPAVSDDRWSASGIDRLIIDDLERHGLTPNSPADRATLLRRIHYDLVGLPPTPEEIQDFLADPSPNAFARVVDRLLSSPRFGQRWGRHWLDVVRFAESSGGGRTLLFPDAWRFRDYVIDSLNGDVPYNRFVTEQLAGDLLPWDDWQERQRNLIATGFLLLGPTNYELQDKDVLEMDVIDEQLDTIGKAFLGMTFGCARCHDHKFDPIPAADYYAMAGIFKSTKSLIHSNVSAWNTVGLPLSAEEESRLAQHERTLQQARKELQQATRLWKQAGGEPNTKQTDRSLDAGEIDAIVLDDHAAEKIGSWRDSTSIPRFVGNQYIHDQSEGRGQKRVIYQHSLDQPGEYEVLISYSPGSNRSRRVPVHVFHCDGEKVVIIDQRKPPPIENAFISLGRFAFDADHSPRIMITNEDTNDGVVIADAVVIFPVSQPLASVFQRPQSGQTQSNRGQTQSNRGQTQSNRGQTQSSRDEDKESLQGLKARMTEIEQRIKQLEQSGPTRPVAMTVQDRSDVGDIHLAIRGVVGQDGPLTPRGAMQVASWESFPDIPPGCSGRLEFAQWVADARHPLTSRVMVNRVWYWMMGRGLVDTVDNFGSTGAAPSHPALLDHLAGTFIQDGWSIKALIRRIALSRVYQLSSRTETKTDVDPSNRKYWRMNRKRLRAEDIRDSILQISGSLDSGFGGPTIRPGTKIEYGYQFDASCRSVYLPVFRNTLPEVFEVFDFADPNIQRGFRNSSTIASQALWMMNHPTVLQKSQRAAEQLLEQEHGSDRQRLDHAYLQVLGRLPTREERAISLDLVGQQHHNGNEVTGWAMLYQMLFQCIDFRYLN